MSDASDDCMRMEDRIGMQAVVAPSDDSCVSDPHDAVRGEAAMGAGEDDVALAQGAVVDGRHMEMFAPANRGMHAVAGGAEAHADAAIEKIEQGALECRHTRLRARTRSCAGKALHPPTSL